MKTTNIIVIALAALYATGAVASLWMESDAAYVIAWLALAGVAVLAAIAVVRRIAR